MRVITILVMAIFCITDQQKASINYEGTEKLFFNKLLIERR